MNYARDTRHAAVHLLCCATIYLAFVATVLAAQDTLPPGVPAPNPPMPDPIAMAVQDVEVGHQPILKVLPKLDASIVPALEQAYLATVRLDPDDAMLLVPQLGDDDFRRREAASRTLTEVRADITPQLQHALARAHDPEIISRLEEILQDRQNRGPRVENLLEPALKIVYAHWFDALLPDRAARLLNDPQDQPAALFFALVDGEKLVPALAKRPVLEQARLELAVVQQCGGDPATLRALGRLDRKVLVAAAQASWWPRRLALPPNAGETILFQSIDGNALVNALVIPDQGSALYPVARAFCIFQVPFGPGNPQLQVGAILRGRYDCRLDTGHIQPFTVRRMIPALPPGMLLPRIPCADGMFEDWHDNVDRVPLWAKPFIPDEALLPTMKFVLNGQHPLPEAQPEDCNLTPGVSHAKMRRAVATWLADPPAPWQPPTQTPGDAGDNPDAPDTPDTPDNAGAQTPTLDAAAAEAFNNATAAQLPAVLAALAHAGNPAWADPMAELALSDRDGAGAAALEVLFRLDPARAGRLALRLSQVQWELARAQYSVAFLVRHFATTPAEKAWDFDHRTAVPPGIAQRAQAAGKKD
ncbi:MAG: hypothetical protein ACREJ2_18775 [Planctomycetota bacterium]